MVNPGLETLPGGVMGTNEGGFPELSVILGENGAR